MQLEGMDALKRAVTRAPETLKAHMGTAVAQTTFAIAGRMRSSVPVRTGTLRGSIESTTRGMSGRVLISGSAYYWRFIEYGTRYQTARPFIRPATESESGQFEQRVRAIGPKLERDFSSGRFL